MSHAEGMLMISELAATTGVSVHAIRSYLAEGLIPRAGRTNGGFGLFDRNAVEQLSIIHAARHAGLPLQAIRPLLRAMNAALQSLTVRAPTDRKEPIAGRWSAPLSQACSRL